MPIITSDLIATTLPQYAPRIVQNLPRLSPVLTQVAKKGNSTSGGFSGVLYRQPLEYNLNTNVMFYSNAEVFRTDRQDIMTHADFFMKQLVGTVTIEGIEEAINDGKEAVHNFVKAKIKNLERSLQQIVADSVYFDGTEYSGKAFSGLPAFYTSTPATGTTGGINRATAIDGTGRYWWRNKVKSIADNPTPATGEPATRPTVRTILHLHQEVKNSSDMPDCMATPDDIYLRYVEEVMEKQMITSTAKERAGYGFNGYVFGFAPSLDIISDSTSPAGKAYMVNTDYIGQRKAKGYWLAQLGKARNANQDVSVESTIAYGNMAVSNLERNGVLVAATLL